MSKFLSIDSQHESFNWSEDPICKDVWKLKYRRRSEQNIFESINRVVEALCDPADLEPTRSLVSNGVFLPAGRILAGAGLDEHDSTLMNCYVMGTMEDSLPGIMLSLGESATTTKFGGGIGLNFGTLRPKGASVSTAAYFAGGPVAFMGMWDAMGHALEAGGNRRGGKMAVMPDHHPDLMEFIEAKSSGGKLTSFNVSVGISNAFMDAVKHDLQWRLWSDHPRHGEELTQPKIGHGSKAYIWDTVSARELWKKILEHTYEYSEPGIMFLDRMNENNNLGYCEQIEATNPCGEQPLPPYGACNLGSINLARCVSKPFKSDAIVDWTLIFGATDLAVRFLDNVLDRTKYPLHKQYVESMNKRRIGLGITGLADMLAMLGIPYGSERGRETASRVMEGITNQAYQTSANLAREKGSFPLWNKEAYMANPFVKRLTPTTRDAMSEWGLRNGILLSIAPTGTISTVFGDVASGCEPTFSHRQRRRIKVKDANNNDTWKPYDSYSFTVKMYAHVHGMDLPTAYAMIRREPDLYQTAGRLSVEDHVKMQGTLQKWVDSSISKTTNVPTNISFEDFEQVYTLAWESGCKGTTTYRPSEVRGAVLIDEDDQTPAPIGTAGVAEPATTTPVILPIDANILGIDYKRPEELNGTTHKIRWPDFASPIFVTINKLPDGRPIEIFISSKAAGHYEWTLALSVMASKLLQMGMPAHYVAEQLKEITISHSPAWQGGKHYGSLCARIGDLLEQHNGGKPVLQLAAPTKTEEQPQLSAGKMCKSCGSRNTKVQEGCGVCLDCGHSDCH